MFCFIILIVIAILIIVILYRNLFIFLESEMRNTTLVLKKGVENGPFLSL